MKALMIAFSMYSRLPMPSFPWEEKDKKYAMCYFPLVGMALGICFLISFFCLSSFGSLLRAAVLTALPFFVVGGIHMDGFMDSCDAFASYGDREKKLSILKDPHTGAFAVLGCVLWVLLFFGAASELKERGAWLVAWGFTASRSLCGILVAVLPGARKAGMLSDFMRDADRRAVFFSCGFFFLLSGGAMALVQWQAALLLEGFSSVLALFMAKRLLREFGGITGDLAGYFLQVCEVSLILLAAVSGRLWR